MYRVAHSVLEHRLSATSVATFITKRAALVRSQRPGSLLLRSAAMEGTVGRRGCKPWVAIGGELPAMLDMDFREAPKGEILRIPLLRASVYKGEKEAGSYEKNLPTVVALHIFVARRVRAEMLVGRRSGMLG